MVRLTPGPEVSVAQESVNSRMLVDMGIVDPDFFSTIMSMDQEITPFMALLDMKGFKTKGLNYGSNFLVDGGRYRTVGSNHVQFRIHNSDVRREHFSANVDGLTFVDSASSTYPGQFKRTFYVYLDSNWIGMNDIALLADGKTQLFFISDGEPVSGGVFEYKVKVDGKLNEDYVDPRIMQSGDEIMLASTKFPQDFSVGGNERHQFGGFGHAYLTLQRFKYSYSGTAAAMDRNKKVTGKWVTSNGDKSNSSFLTNADSEMMKWAGKSLEFQLLEGKGTVDTVTGKVQLTDNKNQEILSGDGVLYSGDGPIEFPIHDGWNKGTIEALLADIHSYLRPDEYGKREIAFYFHPVAYLSFMRAMASMGVTIDSNITGEGDEKIINNTYKGYSLGGLTILAHQSRYLEGRPGKVLKDGTKSNEWDAIGIPLGLTPGGARGVELIQLRPMARGKVAGIDAGGNIATEIDGSSEHVLLQQGVVSQVQPIKVGRPIHSALFV